MGGDRGIERGLGVEMVRRSRGPSSPVSADSRGTRPERVLRVGVDARPDGGPAERDLEQLGLGGAGPPDRLLDLAGVAAELLAEPDRRRVLEVGPAGLDDRPELLFLGGQRGVQALEGGQQRLLDRDRGRQLERRRDRVVRALAPIDVVVRVDLSDRRRAGALARWATTSFMFVFVEVAGSRLVDVDRELVVVGAVGDLTPRRRDRPADVRIEQAEFAVRLGGGQLDQGEGADEAVAGIAGPRSGSSGRRAGSRRRTGRRRGPAISPIESRSMRVAMRHVAGSVAADCGRDCRSSRAQHRLGPPMPSLTSSARCQIGIRRRRVADDDREPVRHDSSLLHRPPLVLLHGASTSSRATFAARSRPAEAFHALPARRARARRHPLGRGRRVRGRLAGRRPRGVRRRARPGDVPPRRLLDGRDDRARVRGPPAGRGCGRWSLSGSRPRVNRAPASARRLMDPAGSERDDPALGRRAGPDHRSQARGPAPGARCCRPSPPTSPSSRS